MELEIYGCLQKGIILSPAAEWQDPELKDLILKPEEKVMLHCVKVAMTPLQWYCQPPKEVEALIYKTMRKQPAGTMQLGRNDCQP
jgi:hypothetical protein